MDLSDVAAAAAGAYEQFLLAAPAVLASGQDDAAALPAFCTRLRLGLLRLGSSACCEVLGSFCSWRHGSR